MAMRKITGGCHCGKVTYEATVDDEKVMVCHCKDCQVLSGTVYRTVVAATEDNIQINGVVKDYVKTAASGHPRIQAFCPDCGTHLYATSVGDPPKMYNLRVGTAEQRNALQPSLEIWCDSALPWNGTVTEKKAVHTHTVAGQP